MAARAVIAPDLPAVRRFEAAGFRAWPAATIEYDGTWAIRLTASHPAKRLNSVNPLDPNDLSRLEQRVARAARRFKAYGRPLTFRMSPLAGAKLTAHLDSLGWSRFDESLVMRLPLASLDLGAAIDQIPLKDVGQFVDAALKVHGYEPAIRPGLTEVIEAIEPDAGLFVTERGNTLLSTAICVVDRDLAGLFEIATEAKERGHGHARAILLSALKWARGKGARTAWLQVEASNKPAVKLYKSMGFEEVYRYVYRRPEGGA